MATEVVSARERSSSRNTSNAVRGDVRTTGGATEKGYSDALKRSILSYEHKQRQEENEAMAFYDDSGNLLYRKQGKRDRVSIHPDEVPSDNLILTHNHPAALGQTSYRSIGNSFTPDDMVMAVKFKAKEMRAVTPSYTFSFKRPLGGWNAKQSEVRRAYERAMRQVREDGEYYYGRAKMTDVANERYMATYYHKVNKLVAKQFGWNYSKKKG